MKCTIVSTLLVVLTFGLGTPAFGAEKGKAMEMKEMAEPSREKRQSMAAAHEKMAACLKSESPFAQCHKEMMRTCMETMGKEGCPMMGHGMKHSDKSEH